MLVNKSITPLIVSVVLFTVLLAIVAIAVFAIRKSRNKISEQTDLSRRDSVLKAKSILLNWIWGVLFLPMLPFSFMAMVSTFMMSDSGEIANHPILMILIAYLFLATPVIIGGGFGLSFFFRKKQNMLWALLIQIVPILYLIMTFGLLFLLFGLF